jgi:hypothetical protein
MKRYSHLMRLALLGGLMAAWASALLAAPSGATLVCPQGVKPPSPYCTNVPPTATTDAATNVRATSATLNGTAGPNVAGGDPTQYFFEYGKTTAYGSRTPTGTIGSCPAGITPPSPYCNTPASQPVSAKISRLKPCTTYHFQLIASNSDGTAKGGDKKFTTKFAPPLTNVSAPHKVKARHKFKVKFTLRYAAKSVTVLIETRSGNVVSSVTFRPVSAGKHSVRITAPRRRGKYFLVVRAKLSCGSQSVKQRLDVH